MFQSCVHRFYIGIQGLLYHYIRHGSDAFETVLGAALPRCGDAVWDTDVRLGQARFDVGT